MTCCRDMHHVHSHHFLDGLYNMTLFELMPFVVLVNLLYECSAKGKEAHHRVVSRPPDYAVACSMGVICHDSPVSSANFAADVLVWWLAPSG
jgi:hypothetical protein